MGLKDKKKRERKRKRKKMRLFSLLSILRNYDRDTIVILFFSLYERYAFGFEITNGIYEFTNLHTHTSVCMAEIKFIKI